ncbi:MAG: acyl carrier protein phosphodiesterase [Cyclobacteriaceae bacterium]|nr:acyl carrier protein phosphodiesterase [Cyclobacteriaceae bacterium]
MNFLAHIYLSGDSVPITIGNFIGDFLRGVKMESFDSEIQKGIRLHRSIDLFTDNHDVVMRSKKRLWGKYRHFSGVIVDIYYDHFLAKNWHEFSSVPLDEYVNNFYNIIISHKHILPERVNQVLPYMMKENWLLNYANFEGIDNVMLGMSRRTKHDSKMEESVKELKEGYEEFKGDFFEFFSDLEQHVEEYLEK